MSRKKTLPAAAALLLGLHVPAQAAPAPPAQAAPAAPASKCDAALARLLAAPPPAGWSSVIARLDGPLTPAQMSQLARLRADVTRRLPFIESVSLRVPTRNLAGLAALPFVSGLSLDGQVRKDDAFTVGSSGAAAAYQQYGLTGQGVTVAVLDSGVAPVDDLADRGWFGVMQPRVSYSPSFVPGDAGTGDACGHGTHVAGIIAGNGNDSSGPGSTQTFYGVARQAGVVSVRVLDQYGSGSVSAVIAGVQWVVQHKDSCGGIRVLNLSLGHPIGESYKTDPLCQAAEAAWKAGIVVVCAAGNDGRANGLTNTAGQGNSGWGTAYGSIQSPGNDPYVITVGAMDQTDASKTSDVVATYSSRGPSRLDLTLKPDIVAPGNRVVSLEAPGSFLAKTFAATNSVPVSAYRGASGWQGNSGTSSSYFVLSGTSMAAPVVAGAAALLLQKYPSLSPDTVKARLMASADKWAYPSASVARPAVAAGNVLGGGASVVNDANAPGGSKVGWFGQGASLQVNGVSVPNPGAYTLSVGYVNGDTRARRASVLVNGVPVGTFAFPQAGTFSTDNVQTIQVPALLNAGPNVVTIAATSGSAPDFCGVTAAGAPTDPCTFGAGYVDIPAALASPVTVPAGTYALSPALTADASGNVSISTGILAADRSVWGTQSLTDLRSVWGSRSVWGTSSNVLFASRSVWGSSVFSDRSIWGSAATAADLSFTALWGDD